MSTSTSLPRIAPSHGQPSGAAPGPSLPTTSHITTGPMDETWQKAIQEYELSDDDKEAFRSAPDIIERLEEMERNRKSPISSSLASRVKKVLHCVKNFMDSLKIFVQKSPEISSLVVGGVNCILTVGTILRYLSLI